MATGQWIARIDDDDIWTTDHLEVLLNYAQEKKYEFVSGQYEKEEYGERKIFEGVRAADYYSYKKKAKGEGPMIGATSTWLYRSYLKFIRYNINCWRKNWNRVNDADFGNRLLKSSVRMGYVPRVLAYILPRPGEDQVGSKVYLSKPGDAEEHYRFIK
jgi:GT2 family glycosyltransferase